MTAVDRADSFARWWALRYTASLQEDVAQRRRGEIRSDVWEHRAWAEQSGIPPALLAVSILRRVVAGMAADMRWQRAQRARAGGRAAATGGDGSWWIRRHSWQALAFGLGAMKLVAGVIAPFEEPAGGLGVALLDVSAGLAVLSGLRVRRSRRVRGDLLIAVGMVPYVATFWTYVLPIAAVIVIAAALVDAADASAVPAAEPTDRDRTRVALVLALVLALAVAALVSRADVAIVLVSPVLAALVTDALVRARGPQVPIVRTGHRLLGTGVGTGLLTLLAVVVSSGEDLHMSRAAIVAATVITSVGAIVGALLLVAASARSRRWARPS